MSESVHMIDESDPCFVFGYVLNGRGGVEALNSASQSVNNPVWLHVDYSEHSAENWLRNQDLDDVVIESLIRPDTRPRTVAMSKGILVVLRGVNTNPGADPEDMVSIRLWIEDSRIITVRQRKLFSIQDVRTSLENGKGPDNIPNLVQDLIERIADRISGFVETIEEQIAEYELKMEEGAETINRGEISRFRRQIASVRRFLAPQRDALEALYRYSKGEFKEGQTYRILEESDRITRCVEDLDLIRERTLVLQEELLNRIAQEQNARMYVLSVVAAIFLPITFITGLFGMNVAGLPGTLDTSAFWLVIIGMVVVTVIISLIMRLKRWF